MNESTGLERETVADEAAEGTPSRGPRWRQRWLVVCGGIVTVMALGGTFLAGRVTASPGPPDIPQQYPAISKTGWPTLGDRADDRSQARQALRLWAARGIASHATLTSRGDAGASDSGIDDSTVLYSGRLRTGSPHNAVLVKTDSELIAYGALTDPDDGRKDVVNAAPLPPSFGTLPIDRPFALSWTASAGQTITHPSPVLVVPPYLTRLHVSGFDGSDARWQPVTTTDGLTPVLTTYVHHTHKVGKDDVPADGTCSQRGVLLHADDSNGSPTRQVTYLYRFGDPYPITLHYFSTPEQDANAVTDQAALDRPEVRELAAELLCSQQGIDPREAVSDVWWKELRRGTVPSSVGSQALVVERRVDYASVRDEGLHSRTGSSIVEEVGVDGKYAYDQPDENPVGDSAPACLTGDGQLAVVGPKNAMSVSLYDPTQDKTWRADGSLLTVPSAGHAYGKGALTATATVPGPGGGVFSTVC